ncbi:hypothetical protein JW964_12580 [candidate division KSB1 bacterium]|nr:hypothetical protein [candidate division KSB1 bacterium]
MNEKETFYRGLGSVLIVIGGILILYFFCQPWLEVNLKIKSMTYSGLQLARSESVIIFIVPLFAISGIIFNFYFLAKKKALYKFFSSLASILGLFFMILLFTQMNGRVIHLLEKMRIFKYTWGIITVLIGFLIQLIGNFIINLKNVSSPAELKAKK